MTERNYRILKFRIGLIPSLLAACFIILLVLIWIIGSTGQRKLEELRISADESTRAYTKRLKLAIDIRETATSTISRARLYQAARGIGIPGPVYKINLNRSKFKLGKLLDEGGKLWSANADTLPAEEIAAWRQLSSVVLDFWTVIDDAQQTAPLELKEAIKQATDPGDVLIELSKIEAPNAADPLEKFFQKRTSLEDAADQLSNVISAGLQKSQDNIVRIQTASAGEVGRRKWVALLMGLIVIGFTIWLMRSYINQTKRQERLKQEAQGRLRSVFDSLSDDIVVLSRQGEVLDVNQSFLRHFKISDAELKLQDYRAALAQLPEIAAFVAETMNGNESTHRQRRRIELKANSNRTDSSLLDVSVSPLLVDEQTEGRVIVIDDVTEDERVREELRRSRTLSAVGQITAQVAHEIYNPLGAVRLNLDLLEMQLGESDEDIGHTIGRLKRSLEHLSTIIMDLRYLTRSRDPERQPSFVNEVLDDVIELAGERLERSRVYIKRSFSPDLPEGKYDQQQLRKVFLNLLINAIEASPQSGEVELRTRMISPQEAEAIHDVRSPNGAIVISVIDHGVGMSEETKRRLFEAFYTTKRNGTGLGMMITQEIINKHGGRIFVESEEGKGSNISVCLPI
jgi:PAS domain S-box-containing protein